MKKLLVVLVAVVFASCSQDQIESPNQLEAKSSASLLDGRLLSFSNDKSFIKEYSELTEMKSVKEIQAWIDKKGHNSLLNNSNDTIDMQNDVVDNKRIIYSDALKAVLNSDSKIKVNGKVIWLNEITFYELSAKDNDKKNQDLLLIKNDLEVYGNLLNKSNLNKQNVTGPAYRDIIPNENRSKTYVVASSRGRHVIDLYNETIVLNDQIASSKMFLRFTPQYRSCSFWRCTWKNENSEPWRIYSGNLSTTMNEWTMISYNTIGGTPFYGQNTFLIATWSIYVPQIPLFQNFNVSGNVEFFDTSVGIPGYRTSLSWF